MVKSLAKWLISLLLLYGSTAPRISSLAQEPPTDRFIPREGFITFEYPSGWITSDGLVAVSVANSEEALGGDIESALAHNPNGEIAFLTFMSPDALGIRSKDSYETLQFFISFAAISADMSLLSEASRSVFGTRDVWISYAEDEQFFLFIAAFDLKDNYPVVMTGGGSQYNRHFLESALQSIVASASFFDPSNPDPEIDLNQPELPRIETIIQSGAPPAPSESSYSSEDARFSFQYPSGWIVERQAGQIIVASSGDALQQFDGATPSVTRGHQVIWLRTDQIGRDVDATTFADKLLQELGTTTAEVVPIDIDGSPGAVSVASTLYAQFAIFIVEIADYTFFPIYAIAFPGELEAITPIAMEFAASLHWNESLATWSSQPVAPGALRPVPELEFPNSPISLANADNLSLMRTFGRGLNTQLSWLPRQDKLAVHGTMGVWLFDLSDFEKEPSLIRITGKNRAISRDGSRLAVDMGSRIEVWEIATGALIRSLRTDALWSHRLIHQLALNSDGTVLASAQGTTVTVWDVTSGTVIATLDGHEREIYAVDISPDSSEIVTGGSDQTVRLWSVATQESRVIFEDTVRINGSIFNVKFSPDGSKVAIVQLADSLWDIHIIDAATEKSQALVSGLHGNISFSPSGDELAFIASRLNVHLGVDLWGPVIADSSTGQAIQTLDPPKEGDISFSPDGSIIAVSGDDGEVHIWDVVTGDFLHTWRGFSRNLVDTVFLPSSQELITLDGRGELGLVNFITANQWNFPSPNAMRRFTAQTMAITTDGRRIAVSGQAEFVDIWDRQSGSHEFRLEGHDGYSRVTSLAFEPFSTTLASASTDGTIRLWDTTAGHELAVFRAHESEVYAISYSPSGHLLASTGSDATLRLWDATGYQLLHTIELEESSRSLMFSPDGSRIAVGGFDEITIHNSHDGSITQRIFPLSGPGLGSLKSLVFSPDGSLLVSVREPGRIELWNSISGALVAAREDPSGAINALSFSPDGLWIATASGDASIRLWAAIQGEPVWLDTVPVFPGEADYASYTQTVQEPPTPQTQDFSPAGDNEDGLDPISVPKQLFVSHDGSVKFDYPSGWLIEGDPSTGIIVLSSSEAALQDASPRPEQIRVSILSPDFVRSLLGLGTGVSPSQTLLAFLDWMSAGDNALITSEPHDSRMGDHNAVRATTSNDDNDALVVALDDGNGSAWVMVAITAANQLESIEPLVVDIVSSFSAGAAGAVESTQLFPSPVADVTSTPLPALPEVAAVSVCSAALPPNLVIDGGAAVIGDNRPVYSEPNPTSAIKMILLETTPFRITAGPVCVGPQNFWQIQTSNGQTGWMPEASQSAYFIQACPLHAVPDYGLQCPDTPPSRLRENQTFMRAIVELRVRESAGLNGRQVGTLTFYELVEILAGPVCSDGYLWWQIRSAETQVSGWVAEVSQDEWLMVPEPWLGCAP